MPYKEKKTAKESGILYTRVPKKLYDRIERLADRNARSKNSVIILMLISYLKDHPGDIFEVSEELVDFAKEYGLLCSDD